MNNLRRRSRFTRLDHHAPLIRAMQFRQALARERPLRIGTGILCGVVMVECLALGANTGFLAMAGATLSIAAAAVVLWLLNPRISYWKAAWPVLAGLVMLLVIAAAPGFLTAPSGQSMTLAPDLFGYGMIRTTAATVLLISSSWIGYRRGGLRLIVGGLIIVGAIDIAVGLCLRQFDPVHIWGLSKGINRYRFTGTLLNANASGCLFGVTAVLATGRLQDWLRHARRRDSWAYVLLAYAGLIVFVIGACAITGSRTALLLTLTAVCGLLVTDRRTRRMLLSRAGLIFGGTATLLLLGLLTSIGDATFVRIGLLDQDFGERWAIWTAFWDVALQAPLLGYGPASFGTVKAAIMQTPDQARLLWYVNSPHNIVIGVILDHGILYLTGLALVGSAMMWQIFRMFRDPSRHPVTVAACAACALVTACACVDIALDVPAIMTIYAIMVGALWGQGLRDQTAVGMTKPVSLSTSAPFAHRRAQER